MKRLSSILILVVVFALVGKTAMTSFCPDVLTVTVTASDWAEETAEEDESGEDDKVIHLKSTVTSLGTSTDFLDTPHRFVLLTATLEILAPPPQA